MIMKRSGLSTLVAALGLALAALGLLPSAFQRSR